MKNLIEMQKLQMDTEGYDIFNDDMNFKASKANRSLPTILVEDIDKLLA